MKITNMAGGTEADGFISLFRVLGLLRHRLHHSVCLRVLSILHHVLVTFLSVFCVRSLYEIQQFIPLLLNCILCVRSWKKKVTVLAHIKSLSVLANAATQK